MLFLVSNLNKQNKVKDANFEIFGNLTDVQTKANFNLLGNKNISR